MAANTKTRWSKAQYRRHRFNRERGAWSPHESTNTKAAQNPAGRWTGASELSAEKEYEQNTMPGTSWFRSDSTDRENFRKQDRAEVRKAFREALGGHHFAKHKGVTSGQLDKIVDAYMSQDDDKFKSTLQGMGIKDKDTDRWRRAAEESAKHAIEGDEIGDRWDDDAYAGGESRPAESRPAESRPAESRPAGLNNGTRQTEEPEGKSPPLTRRQAISSQAQVATAGPYDRLGAADTGVRVNGAPVEVSDTATRNHVKGAQKEAAAADEIMAAETRRKAQALSATGERDRELLKQEISFEQDERRRALQARRQAVIDANNKRRADARYKSGKLSNEDDWNNLGREGSNRRDYTKKADGETDEQFNAAVDKRKKSLEALQARMDKMADTTTKDDKGNYVNSFYANDPNRQKSLAALRKLVDKGIADGTITDAQVDAVTKKLDTWQQGADARASRMTEMQKMREAEQTRGLRQKYGMTDASAFSDQDVLDYHASQQKNARTEALRGMQVAPGIASSGKPEDNIAAAENMQNFSKGWQKLIDAGFDPQKTFQNAMQDVDNKKAYMEGIGTIAQDDPDRADKMDQLRRRFIMNQAMKEHGLTETGGEQGAAGAMIKPTGREDIVGEDGEVIGDMDSGKVTGKDMAANLPGRSILANGPGGNAVVDTANREVAKAEVAAAVPQAPGLTPRKKDETQQAVKGGDALRPRRRR